MDSYISATAMPLRYFLFNKAVYIDKLKGVEYDKNVNPNMGCGLK
jgi:hypothetical protein